MRRPFEIECKRVTVFGLPYNWVWVARAYSRDAAIVDAQRRKSRRPDCDFRAVQNGVVLWVSDNISDEGFEA